MLITCKNCGRAEYTQGDYPDACEYCGEDPRAKKQVSMEFSVQLLPTVDLDRLQAYYPTVSKETLWEAMDQGARWKVTRSSAEGTILNLYSKNLPSNAAIFEKDLWEMFVEIPGTQVVPKKGKIGKKKKVAKYVSAYLDTSIGRVRVRTRKRPPAGHDPVEWEVHTRGCEGIYYMDPQPDLHFVTYRDALDMNYARRDPLLLEHLERKILHRKGSN